MRSSLPALLCLACGTHEVVDTAECPPVLVEPCIEVQPTSISFNPMEVDVNPPQSELVRLTNACGGELEIHHVELEDPDHPFALGALTSPSLSSGSSAEFSVTFDPRTSARWDTRVVITSSDPHWRVVSVDLYGEGVAPVVEVLPAECDFDSYIGCVSECTLSILNAGNADLAVTGLELATDTEELGFDDNPAVNGELPFWVSPGLGVDVSVSYAPVDDIVDVAYLTIHSNDPAWPAVWIPVTAYAWPGWVHRESFEQASPADGVDLLLTMDRSRSMADDASRVVADLASLGVALPELEAELHAAVVVEDSGCVLGDDAWIDSDFSTTEALVALLTMADLDEDLGSAGDYTEAGFSLVLEALGEAALAEGGCNEGLLREEALLVVAHVSDGPEESAVPYPSYVSALQSLKADPHQVVIHAVSGDYPGGCATADPGTGYWEAGVATGGNYWSICGTGWGTDLYDTVERAVALSDHFVLTYPAAPDSIEVWVAGDAVREGWSYDAGTQRVVFDGDHVPDGGVTVEVEYLVMQDCGD